MTKPLQSIHAVKVPATTPSQETWPLAVRGECARRVVVPFTAHPVLPRPFHSTSRLMAQRLTVVPECFNRFGSGCPESDTYHHTMDRFPIGRP